MLVLGIILMLALFGGMGYAMFYVIRKTDPSKVDTSIKVNVETAQEFLPFDDFVSDMLHLGNHQYRIYVEASSINYNLRTDDEKDLVELSFQRFVNSLSHPITLFVQTRKANNEELLRILEEDYLNTVERYPQLREVAQANFEEMATLYQERGSDKEKRKYIIIPFDEAIELSHSSDDEKREYACEELYQRARLVCEGLNAIGLKTKILNTLEIAELVFSTYHKDNYNHLSSVLDGNYGALIVTGKNKIDNLHEEGHLDWILYETQMKLQQELLSISASDDIKTRTRVAIQELEDMRTQLAGYHQQRLDYDIDEFTM